MANNFRFDDNQDDGEYNDNSSQGNYIIQCPSCHARFVLQEEDLAGIEDPRFHCPRCDTLFDAVDANLKEVQYSEPITEGQEEGEEDYQQSYEDDNYYADNEESDENSSVDYDAYEVSENVQNYSDNDEENYQLENNNAQVSTDDSFDPFEDLDSPENKFEYKPISEIKYNQNSDEQNYNYNESFEEQNSSTSDGNKTIRDFFSSRSDINKTSDNSPSGFSLGNDTLNRNETSTIMSDTYSDASYSHVVDSEHKGNRASSWLTSWKRKDENKVGINDTKSGSTETESFFYSTPINAKNLEEKKNDDNSEQYSFKFNDSKTETNKSSNSYSVNTSDFEIPVSDNERNSIERLYREPTQTKTFARQDLQKEKNSIPAFYVYILLPFIVTIMALGSVTYKLVNSSEQQNLIRAFLPSAPTAAPSDLIISELNFKQFPLQSGEILHLISGTIANHTNQSFDNIVLEGLAFDVTGQPLFSKRVNADAALMLAKADVKSFTSEMINDKQDEIPSRRYELASNASQQFAIGIVGDEMRNAKFYSARIYMAE